MRERRDRAYGPYRHRNRWRVVVVGADGSRVTATFASKETARRRIQEISSEAIGRTVDDAIEAYLANSTAKPRSKRTIEYRLRGVLGDGKRLLRKLTPAVAREIFAARAKATSGDTQFHELASARAFFTWCIKRGWAHANPYAGLEPTKPRKRGKPQLRIDEARKLIDVCLAEDSPSSIATALALLCGLRASAVTDRTVRDLDDGGRVLWIEGDKTAAGDRRLEVPEVLRPRLLRLAAGRPPTAKLFPDGNRDWLRYHTRRLCRLADITVVSPHSLRGTHATLARPVVPVEHVARVLGHAGPAITQRHYLAPGIEQEIDRRTVLTVLDGGRGKILSESFPADPKLATTK
jgi:integrase